MGVSLNMLISPIVSADTLDRYLSTADLDLKIIDCRFALGDPDLGRREYNTAHLPGADYLDLNHDLSSPAGAHGGRHPLPDERVLGTKLANMDISADTLVVAYDDSRFGFAARLWWLLRYYGHDRVALLDGGYTNWVKAGYPVTSDLPVVAERGDFQPQLQSDWIVDIDRVRSIQHSPAQILIDAREPDRYLGKTEPIDPRAGHIPSAVNYPWSRCVYTNRPCFANFRATATLGGNFARCGTDRLLRIGGNSLCQSTFLGASRNQRR